METARVMLDTSAYSAFLRGHENIKQALQEADEIYLNPVVIGELLSGFVVGGRERQNRDILNEFLASPRVQVCRVDMETSERYAAILSYLRRRGTPIPTNDLWIAASAMQFGLKLLTTDRHYQKVPQIITECFPQDGKSL